MAVTTSRLYGTGSTETEAANALMNKLPKGKYFSAVEANTTSHKVGFLSSKGDYGGNIYYTYNITGTTHKAIINVAQSENGIFFYLDNGVAVACIITMSDGSEFMITDDDSTSDNITSVSAWKFTPYNASSATLKKIYIPSASSGYVSMCPCVYQDTAIGKIGADSGDVYFIEGIDNSVWSPNGIEINGHIYYGCNKYCTRAD